MRVRILVASYYNTFVSADLSLDSFKYIIEVISTSDNAKIILDKDTLDEGDFSKFFKQVQIIVYYRNIPSSQSVTKVIYLN